MFTLVLVANMGDAPIDFRVVVGLIPAAVIGVNVALLVRFIKPQSALNMAEVSVVQRAPPRADPLDSPSHAWRSMT